MPIDAGGPQGYPLEEMRVTLDRPGLPGLEITPNYSSLQMSTLAVGGFGSCSFTLDGPPSMWRKQIPHLSLIRIAYGGRVLYEGQVEDIGLTISGSTMQTRIAAFGLQRLLAEVSVRRIWIQRSLAWQQGRIITGTCAGVVLNYDPANWGGIAIGAFDPTNLSRVGIEIKGTSDSGPTSHGSCNGVYMYTGGVAINELYFQANNQSGKDPSSYGVQASTNGNTWADASTHTPDTFFGPSNIAAILPAGTTWIRVIAFKSTAATGGLHSWLQMENIRAHGVFTGEDTNGAYYGGTILNDLIALVPGLTIGTIESGNDFGIEEITRSVRSSALEVVNEVAGYYTREWGVWEDGRFDWVTKDLDQPQWVMHVGDLQALDLTATVDGVARTLYILFQDAATQTPTESSATGASQRNPYQKTGRTKDTLVSPGFPMTTASASKLASKLVGDVSKYPLIRGTITLSARLPVQHAAKGMQPAWTLRAGDNILIPDLPISELAGAGIRDGETLFHIVTCDIDLQENRVTLTVEGQLNRADILLARLASVTRVITG